jgi:regulator of protease activity HflC (stomatin/prohibitin superfamily)
MKQQNRGKNIALIGAGLQSAFALVLLIVARRTVSYAAEASMWYMLGGVLVWLMTALLFYCRKLELQEQQELEDLAARGETGGIFQHDRDLSLRPAQARVRFIEKWVVPAFTLLLGSYYAAVGLVVLTRVGLAAGHPAIEPLVNIAEGMLFVIIPGFLAFLFSRYCTGMGSQAQWRPLRPAASQLLLGTLFIASVLGVFAAGWRGYRNADMYVAMVVPAIQIVLAFELVVTFLLDIFRPRVPGEEHRLTYDSRVLGLLAEPTRIGHSIAETLNYQFGFEVSKTWFYQLLGKALVPLIVLGAVVLWALSSLVIVRQGHKGVVLHWGRAQAGRLLEPGLSTKWPWPIDSVQVFDTGKVHDLQVGVGEAREPTIVNGKELQLWTQQHGAFKELPFLLAIPSAQGSGQAGGGAAKEPESGTGAPGGGDSPPPVNIINLVLSVQYRIADPYKFGYKYVDAGKMLENAAYREMVRYCASATLDTTQPGATDRPQAIMTSGWADASKALQDRIAKAVGSDGLDLGVDVASVKLTAVHPPASAAEDFEAVLAAERNQDRLRYEAEGEANKTLADMAGDVDLALELALAAQRFNHLDRLANPSKEPKQSDEKKSPVQLTEAEKKDRFEKSLRGYIQDAIRNLSILRKEIELEDLTGTLKEAAASMPTERRARLSERLREHLRQLPESEGDLRRELRQVASWPILDELEGGGTARQRLAAHQVEILLELLDVRAEGIECDFEPLLANAYGRANALFPRATGEALSIVVDATIKKRQKQMREWESAEKFQGELELFKACPSVFCLDRQLEVWEETLPGMIKYVIGVDPGKIEVWMNWEQQESRGLEGAFEGAGGNK